MLNGELSIDGGEGVNTYTTLGTEEDDAFVLTQEGLRGAGLNTRYQNIQRVNLDAREGNDHIYVLSTRSNVITTLIGGGGSNTFDLSGDVAGNTIVSGRDGSRGVLDGKQPVVVTAQPGALNGSGGAPLALSVSLDMGILPRPASGQAYVSLTSAMLASALYGSLTQGTGLSAADGLAAVRQGLQGRGLLLSTDGGQTWHESVVLAFDANGVGGQGLGYDPAGDGQAGGRPGIGLPPVSLAGRDLRLSATLFTTLPGMHDVALPSIVVPVADRSRRTAQRSGQGARAARHRPANDRRGSGHGRELCQLSRPAARRVRHPGQPADRGRRAGQTGLRRRAARRRGPAGETDAPLGARNTGQAPTAAANNRIRLFDDGTLTGQVGMQDMAAQLSGLGRLYNNPQAGDFGRITGLGMTPGVGAAAGSIFQASEAGIHGYDRGIVFHGVQSVNTMLGQGDDTYTVRHAPVGTVTLVQGGGGNNTLVVRERPWAAPAGRCCCSAPPVRTTATTPPRPATGWRAEALAFGRAGNNVLDARATQGVILYGGAGDDLIHGGSGNDLIAGGGGNNTIHAGQGNNIVFGNAGLNIDLGTPMDMRSSPDLRSLYALTLVLSRIRPPDRRWARRRTGWPSAATPSPRATATTSCSPTSAAS